MRVIVGSENVGLKLNIQKIKIMVSTTSWQIDWWRRGGEWWVETVTDFIFFFQNHCGQYSQSHDIKRCLLLGRKAMTKVYNILKSTDITLLTKVHLVKSIVFLVLKYRYDSWTIKKAEGQRIDAFKSWCWRRLLRVPWSAKRSIQLIQTS